MECNTERMLQFRVVAVAIEVAEGWEILTNERKETKVVEWFEWSYSGICITTDQIADKALFQCHDTNAGTTAVSNEQHRLTVQSTIADTTWCS